MRISATISMLAATLAMGAERGTPLGQPGRPLFPIGSYEMPKDDDGLRAMVEAGINLLRCRNRQDLDRAAAAGVQGWIPLPLQIGTKDGKLREMVETVKDHPALALWEGPDEIVWNFTAYSGLARNGTFPTPDEWWRQSPLAIKYSETQAAAIMPNVLAAVDLIRKLDGKQRQVWINEAARSDLKFIRQYIDAIDITGCDIYPIHASRREPTAVADYTERYKRVGRGRPVWMVLQGFAWGELKGRDEAVTYPTFAETRLMAWSAIARGAKGVLYWGMDAAPPSAEFRTSLYAMTSELAALQPFLTAPDAPGVRVEAIDCERFDVPRRGVTSLVRRARGDWLIVLVNEDNRPHMGVAVTGLEGVARLEMLYGDETAPVRQGEFVTRLMPYEVKVFAGSRKWESKRTAGRGFATP